MVLTLTLWQKKSTGHPTLAGQGRLLDPTMETFEAAIAKLLTMTEPSCKPFQLVAQMGDSSRGFQLEQGWSHERIISELWKSYQSLIHVNG